MLNGKFYAFYAAMDIIKLQLENEIAQRAVFKMENEQIFKALNDAIINNRSLIDGKNYYAGHLYKSGLTGYVEELKECAKKRGYYFQ